MTRVVIASLNLCFGFSCVTYTNLVLYSNHTELWHHVIDYKGPPDVIRFIIDGEATQYRMATKIHVS